MDRAEDEWLWEDDRVIEALADQRMTVSLVLELTGRPPPVLFDSQPSLRRWASENGLRCTRVGKVFETNMLRVQGWFDGDSLSARYDLVWVRANYSRYSRAKKRALNEMYRLHIEDPITKRKIPDPDAELPSLSMKGLIDADHVVARKSLREHHAAAWVVLFPVPCALNQAMGSKFEKFLPSISVDTKVEYLSAYTAFKLYAGAMPSNRQQFAQVIQKKVERHFQMMNPDVSRFVATIRETLEPSFAN